MSLTVAACILLAMCLGLVLGVLARSAAAWRAEGLWRQRCERLKDRFERMAAIRDAWRAEAEALRTSLGEDAWLADGLEALHGELRPGERAENLALLVRWKATADLSHITIDRGEREATRSVLLHATDGETCWQEPEEVDLPPADSPEWITG